ncbi:MAG: hypothetical protein KJ927_15625, partial [Candidatus Eisenbacteria bacterium]|nr:hypothetical protein [Candidatus Eisenbacteria bacterium]
MKHLFLILLLLCPTLARAMPAEAALSYETRQWHLAGGDGEAELRQNLIPFWIHLLPHPTLETWINSSYSSSSLSKRADGDLSGLSSVRFECDWQPG